MASPSRPSTSKHVPAEAGAPAPEPLGADGKVELVFFPTFVERQLPGTKGTNAMDFARVIARYDLLYAVTNKAGDSTMVDAYTGDVRSRASGTTR